MSTKIFYNDNRIIIDGHADNVEECQAITAMCDSLANDENFKTIVYEEGHAVFERVNGGDVMMFLAGIITADDVKKMINSSLDELKNGYLREIYLNQSDAATLYATKSLVNDGINNIIDALGEVDPGTQGSIAQQIEIITARIEALENRQTKTLPYTADQLIAKLESI